MINATTEEAGTESMVVANQKLFQLQNKMYAPHNKSEKQSSL